jgi:hypothetical protein
MASIKQKEKEIMENKEFKIGDRVVAVKPVGNKEMVGVEGTVISSFVDSLGIKFDKDIGGHDCLWGNGVSCEFGYGWFCARDKIKKIEDDKVIFNDKATILFKDGKKFVSKCDNEDTFDKEKGLLLCIAKSAGYTYEDILELLGTAKSPVKEVKRHAKEGEYIKIVDRIRGEKRYKNGDIVKVTFAFSYSGVMCGVIAILDKEYVVLENYVPKEK